jgi:hypothetical protein
MLLSILDAVAFSSIWVAAAAGALCASAALAMGVTPTFSVAGIAVSGTLFVYNVDRLRDLDRDRATTPERSAFVERNRGILGSAIFANAIASKARDAEAAGERYGLIVVDGALLAGALLAVGWRVA